MQGQGSHSQAKQSEASFITVYKSKGCVYGGQQGLAQSLRYSSRGQEPAATQSDLHLGPSCMSNVTATTKQQLITVDNAHSTNSLETSYKWSFK